MEPLAGVILSQPALAEALKFRGAPVAVTLRLCGTGAVPPACPLKDRLTGAAFNAESDGAGVSVNATGTVTAGPPVGVSVTLPL